MTDLERATKILAKLVSFDTTSSRSNVQCIEWIEEYLREYGVYGMRVENRKGDKSNLWVTIGPEEEPGYILSGHTDTVPVTDQSWSANPFQLTERNGCYYGRGTADMKGFVAVCLAMVPKMMSGNLRHPIHLALSYDEEVGCIGVRSLLQYVSDNKTGFLGCFVGEPTRMRTIIGHKGSVRYWVDVKGKSVHSSLVPHGVNAIEYAAKVISRVHDVEREMEKGGARDPLFDVAHTTLQVGMVNGGIAPNVVPDAARFTFEVRAIGSDDPVRIGDAIEEWAHEELVPKMKSVSEEAGIFFEKTTMVPGFDLDIDAPLSRLSQELSSCDQVSKASYGTEAGLFCNTLGVPTVVIGPGNIEQAHRPDEFIERAQIAECIAFVERLIGLCGKRTG